jgi:mycofactocin biosynthesis protein MftB
MTVTLDSACELHPQVALRPESFGALAYHYGNRKLVFLKHPDVVAVLRDVAAHDTLADTLVAHNVAPERWSSFVSALSSLETSEIIRVRQ